MRSVHDLIHAFVCNADLFACLAASKERLHKGAAPQKGRGAGKEPELVA